MNRLILEQYIRSLILQEVSDSPYVNLKVGSFQDRDTRVKTLIRKLKDEEALTLQKGSAPVVIKQVDVVSKEDPNNPLTFTSANFDKLATVLPNLKSYDKLIFTDTEDDKYPITAFAKTPELGGLGKGATLKVERGVIDGLNKQIHDLGGSVDIKFGGETYYDIVKVVNVKENQKADFAFATNKGPVLFLSYKPGSSAKSFHHYGGVAGISSDTVDKFAAAVLKITPGLKKGGPEYGIELTKDADSDLILKAMYGSNYGSKQYGINNVQGIVQGDNIQLVGNGNPYTIQAAHILIPPTIPTDDYAPWLAASFAGDRHQGGIKNCRLRVVTSTARGKNNLVNPMPKTN